MKLARVITAATTLLLAAGLGQAFFLARRLQVTAGSTAWLALFVVWTAALLLSLAAFRAAGRGALDRYRKALARLRPPRAAAMLLLSLSALVLPGLVLAGLPDPLGLLLDLFWLRAFIFWMAALAGAACLGFLLREAAFPQRLALAALAFGAVYRAAMFLPDVSTYPFSLGWSETSRYYYASLYLSRKIYGTAANPSVLHPTRYMLQAVPFLIQGLPLWAHRAWQVVLWLGLNGLAAWALVRRMGQPAGARRLILGLWAFLFLFQAPVWYHLVVLVGFVLWGVDFERPWKTLLVVAAASLWAGISRVNWVPFPAALAALVYVLEVPRDGRPLVRYFLPPLLWGLAGIGFGLGAQAGYAVLSGNDLEQFTSSFTSDLLWYRLFPSATYPLGVIPGVVLVSLPVFWGAAQRLGPRWQALEPLRRLALLGVLGVFLAGGLVVSAKIGGGSNLHNLDGYIALLMVFGAYAWLGVSGAEGRAAPLVLALAVMVPVGYALGVTAAFPRHDPAEVSAELAELDRLVGAAAADGGEVLFIAERHLLAFDPALDAGLVEDYEKVFLMEMAMAGNTGYLGRFKEDLAAKRFALIVSDIVNYNLQTRADDFGEENNAWDLAVTYPLLCYYQEVQTLETARVEILVPKAEPSCPEVPAP